MARYRRSLKAITLQLPNRSKQGTAALIHAYGGHPYAVAALKLAPLVFVRTGELRQAEWSEFDLGAAEWRIPGSEVKKGQDHIVPLAYQTLTR
nr:hypothetical protein [Massilia sp. JS1662]